MNKKLFSIIFLAITTIFIPARIQSMQWLRSPAGKVFSDTCTAIGFCLSAYPLYSEYINRQSTNENITQEHLKYLDPSENTQQFVKSILEKQGINDIKIKIHNGESLHAVFQDKVYLVNTELELCLMEKEILQLLHENTNVRKYDDNQKNFYDTMKKNEYDLKFHEGAVYHEASHILNKDFKNKEYAEVGIPAATYAFAQLPYFLQGKISKITALTHIPLGALLQTTNNLLYKKIHRSYEYRADNAIPIEYIDAHIKRYTTHQNDDTNRKKQILEATKPICRPLHHLKWKWEELQSTHPTAEKRIANFKARLDKAHGKKIADPAKELLKECEKLNQGI